MYFWSATRLPTCAVSWRVDGAVTSLTAIAKATFALAPGDATLASAQEPIVEHDVLGPDGRLVAPSDLAPFKTRVDVVLVGSTFPARPGAPAQVRLSVGGRSVGAEARAGATAHSLPAFATRRPDRARGLGQWNVAPRDLQLDELPEDLQLTLEHLSPIAPALHVAIPAVHFSVYAAGGGIDGSHAMRADTLWIDTDRQIACITYRATFSLRAESELRATILADHPSLAQEPASLVLLERDGDDEDDALPSETGMIELPTPDHAASHDALPFRAASAAPATSPPPMHAPPPASDDAPATVPPPPATTPPPAPALALPPPLAAPPFVAPPLAAPRAPAPTIPQQWPIQPSGPVLAPSGPVLAAPPAIAPPPMMPPPQAASAPVIPPAVVPPAVPSPVVRPFAEAAPPPKVSTLMHDASAAHAGVAGASDAAAGSTRRERAGRRRGAYATPRPPLTSGDICDLLWFEPSAPRRIRQVEAWGPAVNDPPADRAWLTTEETKEQSEAARDRRTVTRALARVAPVELSTLPTLLADSFDEAGVALRPLLVLVGELSVPLDVATVIKTSADLASALCPPDKVPEKPSDKPSEKAIAAERLREAIAAARDVASAPRPAPPLAQAVLTRLRQALAQAVRALPSDYLETTVNQMLLEERRHDVREIFGGPHVLAQIQPGSGAPTQLYLPAAAAPHLPVARRLRARIVAEPHASQDENEGPVLRALAIGRVVSQRR